MSNGVFNFNFLAVLLSELLGGPKFTLEGPALPEGPVAENFDKRASTCLYLYNCKCSAS